MPKSLPRRKIPSDARQYVDVLIAPKWVYDDEQGIQVIWRAFLTRCLFGQESPQKSVKVAVESSLHVWYRQFFLTKKKKKTHSMQEKMSVI